MRAAIAPRATRIDDRIERHWKCTPADDAERFEECHMSFALTLLSGVDPSPRAARVHAIKNCVSVIIATSSLVGKDLTGSNRERWTHLQSAASRLRELLVEELSGGDTPPSLARPATLACVASLVNEVLSRVAHRAEAVGVELFTARGTGSLVGDQDALAEALFNLVANAIDATPSGGRVFLTTHEMADGDQHWIIQDTGRGIPADLLVDLGRPLPSRQLGGSGLGLALARETIVRHGGLLRVESCVGSGTMVTVWLPRGSAS